MNKITHVRFRDTILNLLAEKVLKSGLRVARVRSAREKVRGVPTPGGANIPCGDLVIIGQDSTAIVDVGGRGGAFSILRCWRHCSNRILGNEQPVALFYVAITRSSGNDTESRSLWDFTARQAQAALGKALELHYAACAHPATPYPLGIQPSDLAVCEEELRTQGFLPAFEAWVARASLGPSLRNVE